MSRSTIAALTAVVAVGLLAPLPVSAQEEGERAADGTADWTLPRTPVTTRYGADALCAHFVSVSRSASLSSSGAAGWFIPAGILPGALTVNIFQGHTTSPKFRR